MVCPSKGMVIGSSNILHEQHQNLKERGPIKLRRFKGAPKAAH